nr:MAG TPA_asm: hypothetical protein [Bacteriophage sp.]DAQ63910.1 MAG TPA: hypothetical protein [Caudoviricetes sp.]
MLFKEYSCLSKFITIINLLIKVNHNYLTVSYRPITPPPLTLPDSSCSALACFIAISNDLTTPLTSLSIRVILSAVSISILPSEY